MNGAPFRHIGGMVIADHGPLPLAAAQAIAELYGREALEAARRGERRLERACRARADALLAAGTAAIAWRRAAGWRDPHAADQPVPHL